MADTLKRYRKALRECLVTLRVIHTWQKFPDCNMEKHTQEAVDDTLAKVEKILGKEEWDEVR